MFTVQGGDWVVTGINAFAEKGICDPMGHTWVVNVATFVDDIEDLLDSWSGDGADGGPDADSDVDYDGGADSDGDTDSDSDGDAEEDDMEGQVSDGDDGCQCNAPGAGTSARENSSLGPTILLASWM